MEASAIICDYAQVHAGKLYMIGAGANLVLTASPSSPHPINCAAGVLINIPWNAHNHLHRLKISLVSEDGEVIRIAEPLPGQDQGEETAGSFMAQFNAGRSALMSPGDESVMPIAVPLNIEVPALKSYSVDVEVDETRIAQARFRVAHFQQGPGFAPPM